MSSRIFAVCALFAACARVPDLLEIPRAAMEKFLPATRERIEAAYADARRNPRDAAASGKLGMMLFAHELHTAAWSVFNRAHHLDSKSFDWLYYRGAVEAAEGRHAEAVATLRQALAIEPRNLEAALRLADSLFASGEIEESGRACRQVIASRSDVAAAHYGLGRVEVEQGRLSQAAEAFAEACRLYPAYGSAHFALAATYRKLGDTQQAAGHQSLAEKHKQSFPPVPEPLMERVRSLNQGAVAHVRAGIDLDKAGRLAESAAAHERALEIDPKLVQARINLISIYGRLGQNAKAREQYQAAVEINPNLAECHYNYGVMVYGEGKFGEAKEAFGKALEIEPGHADAHNNLGSVLEREGRLDAAAEHFQKAIAIRPDHRQAHFHLGRILVHRNSYEQAIAHFEKAAESDDDNTPAYFYALAGAHARAGNREAAIRWARAAREGAMSKGQTQLARSIERDLNSLQGAARSK